MAKYIDRELLPQFKLYHSYSEKDHGWNVDTIDIENTYVDTQDGMATHFLNEDDIGPSDFLTMSQDISEDEDKMLAIHNALDTDAQNTIFVEQMLIKNVIKDTRYSDKWLQRLDELKRNYIDDVTNETNALDYLAYLDGIYEFFDILQLSQGFPKQGIGDMAIIPKLLLLDADLYNKCKNKDVLDIDAAMISSMPKDQAMVFVINGESAEKKMVFVLINVSSTTKIHLLDPINGISTFPISYRDDNGGLVITSNPEICHPRGDYNCAECWEKYNTFGREIKQKENEDEEYAPNISEFVCRYDSEGNKCQHKIMKCVASVLYCYAEYRKKIINAKAGNEQQHASAKDKDKTQPFVPKNAIKVYDIKMTAEELQIKNKYAKYNRISSHYTSTEKCPHTRRGTWRYNHKTGQKDIWVSGCVIHKEKYEGFASADRFGE